MSVFKICLEVNTKTFFKNVDLRIPEHSEGENQNIASVGHLLMVLVGA